MTRKLPPEDKQDTWLQCVVTADVAERFKRIADENDRPVSGELRRLVKAHVEAHAKP